ncbi:MAG: FAD-dependent oxidoreductase [Crenarchaeota archaeon]|nr:FAD-dependent oxidoreductase [Thermoproteota archaeon]
MAGVVVAGLGFGGVEALKRLVDAGVCRERGCLVVAPSTMFTFLPALPEVVSGRMSVSDVCWDAGGWLRRLGVEYRRGSVERVSDGLLYLSGGGEVGFDYLVAAWGAEPAYYGVPGAREYTVPLYSAGDAERLSRELRSADTFLVVGAGLVGVELAAEAAWATMTGRFSLKRIVVVDLLDKPLAVVGSRCASERAERILRDEFRVELVMGRRVVEVREGSVVLEGGLEIGFDVAAWCAGVKGRGVVVEGAEADRRGFIRVDRYMRATKGVYVVGDAARVEHGGCVALKMVREAMRQARTAVDNIVSELRGGAPRKAYKPLITSCRPLMAVGMGPRHAVVVIGKRFCIDTGLAYRYKEWWRRRLRRMHGVS